MRVLAFDIGGANIKASDGERRSLSQPFALWQHPERLPDELHRLLDEFAGAEHIAVTMTGELADCFATKAEGVERILAAVEHAAGERPIAVWQTGGEFVSTADARELTPLVAAANWHALATWTARMSPTGAALLVDLGSTTLDIIPLVDGMPDPAGRTDRERLLSGELVYRGVRRTPLCAIASEVSFGGRTCPLAAELFATTLDLWLLTGDLPESPSDRCTANGGPATRAAAHDRLARMLCCDRDELSLDAAAGIAEELASRLEAEVAQAIQRVAESLPQSCSAVVTSGEGEFLVRRVLGRSGLRAQTAQHSLREMLGPEHSQAACAFALARLSIERGCSA